MKLLIDANILLDVLQNRKTYVRESSVIWKLCEVEKEEGCVSALTMANLVYIMRKELSPEKIQQVIQQLSLIFTIVDLNAADLVRAADLQCDDFEDALQSMTASRIHADYIITRNVRDYCYSKVPAKTPSEWARGL